MQRAEYWSKPPAVRGRRVRVLSDSGAALDAALPAVEKQPRRVKCYAKLPLLQQALMTKITVASRAAA